MSRPISDVHSSEREYYDRKMEKELSDSELILDDEAMRRGEKLLGLIGLEGDLKDKKILETGCGGGKVSSFLALKGGDVKAFDISPRSVAQTLRCAEVNGVGERVDACPAAFEHLPYEDNSFDFVIGLFILHHLPDLDAALIELQRVMKPGGRAFFVETSALNPLLRFFRDHVVGRFGIPKMGTDDEYPLTLADTEIVERRFPEQSEIYFPSFHFFQMFNEYVFRGKLPVSRLFKGLDRLVYFGAPFLRKYSYHMIVCVSKAGTAES